MTGGGMTQGVHELPTWSYHDDVLVDSPTLSRGDIVTLLNSTPAHCRAKHPRLTEYPEAASERKTTKEQDLGSVIHRLVLARGAGYRLITGFQDWRTKAAQAAREQARAEGEIPILEPLFDAANQIAEKAIAGLQSRFGAWPIGPTEQTLLWQRETPRGRIWCRALADVYAPDRHLILDLKTTGKPLSDEVLQRDLASSGNDLQCGWYLEGAEATLPAGGAWTFAYLFVETAAPYAVRYVTISESWLTRVRLRIERAAETWAECLESNTWPSWPAECQLSAPAYMESRWLTEELEGDE